jgi:hypothetical protein
MAVTVRCRCGYEFLTPDNPGKESRPCPVCGTQQILSRLPFGRWVWVKMALRARLHGLLFIIVGIGFIVLGALLIRVFHLGRARSIAAGILGIPLALGVFVGWLELLTGVRFWQLSATFDQAQGVKKAALTLLVLIAIGLFFFLVFWFLSLLFSKA